jgi:Rps23 Pro-64 3,4-dihydroxylase Tpa1-like proline 4-hydroxylase
VTATVPETSDSLAAVLTPRALEVAAGGAGAFQSALPFPHIVIDDFLQTAIAEDVLGEFDATNDGWTFLHHFNEKKRQLTDRSFFHPATEKLFAALQSPAFVHWLEQVTGEERLIADASLEGAGLHEIHRGGFLNMHVDFHSHATRRTLSRQLNLLIYLNHDWDESYQGHLEFWNNDVSRCEKRIAPLFNRCVIFKMSDISYHGHPVPLACPPERSRRSLALYYYRDEGRNLPIQSTRYEPRPTDKLGRRMLIYLDRGMLRAFSLLKRYAGLSDRLVSRILKHF